MTSIVPNVSPTLPGVIVNDLQGFREQESWGRWTLGKTTSISLNTAQSVWVDGHFDLSLPYSRQHLDILLNGRLLQSIGATSKRNAFSLNIPLNLKFGTNKLQLDTDKSNMDSSLVPFAPLDHTDMSIRLNKLEISPLKLSTMQQSGHLYGASQAAFPTTYQNVSGTSIELFFQRSGSQLVTYRLLRGTDDQAFNFLLDSIPVYQSDAGPRGTLALGQFRLQADNQLHQLRVVAQGGKANLVNLKDSIQTLEKINGPFTFYVQKITLTPYSTWEQLTFPLTLVGVFICVGSLAFWLLRNASDSTSGE